jgi:hypothetical protein
MCVFKKYTKLFIKWMSRKKIRYGLWPDNASYEDKNQGNKIMAAVSFALGSRR